MGGQACCFAIFPPQGPVFLDREANDQSPGKKPFESAASHSTTYSFPIQGARRELGKGIIRHIKSSETERKAKKRYCVKEFLNMAMIFMHQLLRLHCKTTCSHDGYDPKQNMARQNSIFRPITIRKSISKESRIVVCFFNLILSSTNMIIKLPASPPTTKKTREITKKVLFSYDPVIYTPLLLPSACTYTDGG